MSLFATNAFAANAHPHARASSITPVTTGRLCATVALLLAASAAFAHPGHGELSGFASGFSHPWLGLDHLLAMLAVGIWSAQIGGRAQWLLPLTFPLVMLVGGALGMSGMAFPGVETGIAVSALLLGALVLLVVRPTLAFAAPLVGIFALFHGYAHGAELPHGADGLTYSAGFVVATVMLHLLGLAAGSARRWQPGALALRGAGGVIAAVGAFLVVRTLA